jgi:hypothetical protein
MLRQRWPVGVWPAVMDEAAYRNRTDDLLITRQHARLYASRRHPLTCGNALNARHYDGLGNCINCHRTAPGGRRAAVVRGLSSWRPTAASLHRDRVCIRRCTHRLWSVEGRLYWSPCTASWYGRSSSMHRRTRSPRRAISGRPRCCPRPAWSRSLQSSWPFQMPLRWRGSGCSKSGPVRPRFHLDIGADHVEAEVVRLTGLGAVKIADGRTWAVMRDPSGSLFDTRCRTSRHGLPSDRAKFPSVHPAMCAVPNCVSSHPAFASRRRMTAPAAHHDQPSPGTPPADPRPKYR